MATFIRVDRPILLGVVLLLVAAMVLFPAEARSAVDGIVAAAEGAAP